MCNCCHKALFYLLNTVVNIPWLFLLERMKMNLLERDLREIATHFGIQTRISGIKYVIGLHWLTLQLITDYLIGHVSFRVSKLVYLLIPNCFSL